MNALIIEDEQHAAQRLINLLHETGRKIEILDTLDSIESSIKWLKENPDPDVIFLDIQLADGLSFAIFDQVEVKSPVIFATAYDEYAIKAFEINSIDYLLKPIKQERLEASLEKLEKLRPSLSPDEITAQLQNMILDYHERNKTYRSRFLVNKADTMIPIAAEDIAFLYTEDKVVFLITRDNRKYMINYSLDQLEKQLNPISFFRVNRQFIVAMRSIHKIHNYFNYKLKIELVPVSEQEVIVSRQKVAEFKEWLDH
ncbi:MAG: LytTR family DNA-binding domain-containing protein [Bacteroidota bacterium]|nr:LytTR family DNA-binding domain-containing protein [Bacteroidota bacterium]